MENKECKQNCQHLKSFYGIPQNYENVTILSKQFFLPIKNSTDKSIETVSSPRGVSNYIDNIADKARLEILLSVVNNFLLDESAFHSRLAHSSGTIFVITTYCFVESWLDNLSSCFGIFSQAMFAHSDDQCII